ncbi:hypothetical protein F5Y14DRAFT_209786 [Nemania sp. NC0429]|nr:hypothetical protein F5Y14DRAFT_209786 [Nemania sp. NC0429]
MSESTLTRQKRKRGVDAEPRPAQKRAMSSRSRGQQHSESTATPDSDAENAIQPSPSSSPISQESPDDHMTDAESVDLMGPRCGRDGDESSWDSSLGDFMSNGDRDSFNSVRPPDPLYFSDSIPYDLTEIPSFLFYPRPPPTLPAHILELRFGTVLRRYNRLTKLVDDYQRWHGRTVFAFWTDEDIALAKSGQVPALTKAFNEDRPSVPPQILNTPFNIVLLMAPLLSHLIERYHNDLGYRYFAFYRFDPREKPSDYAGDVSVSNGWHDRREGAGKIGELGDVPAFFESGIR